MTLGPSSLAAELSVPSIRYELLGKIRYQKRLCTVRPCACTKNGSECIPRLRFLRTRSGTFYFTSFVEISNFRRLPGMRLYNDLRVTSGHQIRLIPHRSKHDAVADFLLRSFLRILSLIYIIRKKNVYSRDLPITHSNHGHAPPHDCCPIPPRIPAPTLLTGGRRDFSGIEITVFEPETD